MYSQDTHYSSRLARSEISLVYWMQHTHSLDSGTFVSFIIWQEGTAVSQRSSWLQLLVWLLLSKGKSSWELLVCLCVLCPITNVAVKCLPSSVEPRKSNLLHTMKGKRMLLPFHMSPLLYSRILTGLPIYCIACGVEQLLKFPKALNTGRQGHCLS